VDDKTAELVAWLRKAAKERHSTWTRNVEAADTIERLANLVDPPDKQLNRDAFGEPALPGQMTLFGPEPVDMVTAELEGRLFSTSNVAEWVARQTCNQGGTHE
jgi:hypothetical protein